jgi:hypothetical protein
LVIGGQLSERPTTDNHHYYPGVRDPGP